jgi:hypothetical protein
VRPIFILIPIERNNNLSNLYFETNLLLSWQELRVLPHYWRSTGMWDSKQGHPNDFLGVSDRYFFLHFAT